MLKYQLVKETLMAQRPIHNVGGISIEISYPGNFYQPFPHPLHRCPGQKDESSRGQGDKL